MNYEELAHIKADRKLLIKRRANSHETDVARFVRWRVTKDGERVALVQRFDVWGNCWLKPVQISCATILGVY